MRCRTRWRNHLYRQLRWKPFEVCKEWRRREAYNFPRRSPPHCALRLRHKSRSERGFRASRARCRTTRPRFQGLGTLPPSYLHPHRRQVPYQKRIRGVCDQFYHRTARGIVSFQFRPSLEKSTSLTTNLHRRRGIIVHSKHEGNRDEQTSTTRCELHSFIVPSLAKESIIDQNVPQCPE